MILHHGSTESIYNISGSKDRTVLDIARELVGLIKGDVPPEDYVLFVPDRAHNDMRYAISGDQLRSLGWKEEVDWNIGLRGTIEWYRIHTRHWGDIEHALSADPREGHTDFPAIISSNALLLKK